MFSNPYIKIYFTFFKPAFRRTMRVHNKSFMQCSDLNAGDFLTCRHEKIPAFSDPPYTGGHLQLQLHP